MIRNYSLVWTLVLILFFLLWEFLNAPRVLKEENLLFITSVAIFSVFLFLFKKEPYLSLKNQYFRISNLFLISFILVHYQIYVDFILGNYYKFGHDYLIDKTVVSKTSVISTTALVSFLIGYLIRIERGRLLKPSIIIRSNKLVFFSHKGLIFLGYTCYFIFLGTANWNYFKGQYGQESLGPIADSAQFYLILSIYAIVLVKCRSYLSKELKINSFLKYFNLLGKPLLILVLLYLPLVILSGDRGPVLQILLVIFGGYIIVTKYKYKLIHLGFLLTIGIGVVSVMGIARQLRDEDSYVDKLKNVENISSSYSSSNSFSPRTMELATSVRTLHAAVSFTESHGYTYGVFQAYQIIGIVPGLGSLFKSLTGLGEEQVRSSVLLSKEILGDDAYGLGTTCVADIYLDFGIIGLIPFFLSFGYFIRFLDEQMYMRNPINNYVWVLIFVFLAKAIYMGRSSIIILFREWFFVVILITIGLFISKYFFKETSSKFN